MLTARSWRRENICSFTRRGAKNLSLRLLEVFPSSRLLYESRLVGGFTLFYHIIYRLVPYAHLQNFPFAYLNSDLRPRCVLRSLLTHSVLFPPDLFTTLNRFILQVYSADA